MREHLTSKLRLGLLGLGAALLSACGGGGGEGGSLVPSPNRDFQLSFTADKTQLALNINKEDPTIGGPYTASINVRSNYVPGGGDGGNCWVANFTVISGYPTVQLWDGDAVRVDTGTNFSSSYMTVSSSGNWNAMLNATNLVGTATIEVAVPDPNTSVVKCNDDKIEVGPRYANQPMTYVRKTLQVQVGGASTGRPAQIVLNKSTNSTSGDPAGFLYLQGMNDPTRMIVQAELRDEAGQPVSAPAGNNLIARLLNVGDTGAYLQSGGVTGTEVRARSINGQAQFALHSGTKIGTLLLEVRADRADNDVDNGISDVVYNVATVPMVAANPNSGPLAITSPSVTALCRNQANSVALQATGGTLPYSWYLQASQNLPAGLTFRSDGSFGGLTTVAAGTNFQLNVGVRDSAFPTKGEDAATLSFTVVEAPRLQFVGNSTERTGVVNLLGADIDRLGRAQWSWTGNASIVIAADGRSATFTNQNQPKADGSIDPVNGTATVTFDGGCQTTVSFTLAGQAATGDGSGGGSGLAVTTGSLPAGTVGVPYGSVLAASGGKAPYTWTAAGLPPGLAIDGPTGLISGSPTNTGTYTVVVSVKDADGKTGMRSFTLTISNTSSVQDTTPPRVLWSIPQDGAPGIDLCSDLTFRFSEDIDVATVSNASVGVKDSLTGTPVTGYVVEALDKRTFQLRENILGGCPLQQGKNYRLVISTSVRDIAGNPLAQEYVATFGAGSALDSAAPKVVFTIPADRAVDVSPTANVTVVFSEGMDVNSIAPESFAVYRIDGFGGSPTQTTVGGKTAPSTLPTVTGLIAETDRRFTFGPVEYSTALPATGLNLVPGQHYRVVMSASPRDLAGNQICNTSGQCGTAANPVEGGTPSYVFEFRVGVQ